MEFASSIVAILMQQLYTVSSSITSTHLQTRLFQETQTCVNDYYHHPISDHQVFSQVCYRQKSVCNSTKCSRCPAGYCGDQCENIIVDCRDGQDRSVVPINSGRRSYIQPSVNGPVIEGLCDFKWRKTLIMRRTTLCKEVNFNRTWNEYVMGFGTIHGEYWLCLENVIKILQNFPSISFLNFVLQTPNAKAFQSNYYGFGISNSSDNYKVSFTIVRAMTSGNSLTHKNYSINGRPFSTYDRDHTSHNCPGRFNGRWWYLDDSVCIVERTYLVEDR